MKVAIPCFVSEEDEHVNRLMLKFGNARRRAYSMKRKGVNKLEILRRLREETGLHNRYVWTAYEMIKDLPPYVTFGGLELQRLRERGKVTKEGYRRRRNDLLACFGQTWYKGNPCLRIEGNRLRINIAPRRWIHLPLRIPERYEGHRKYLDGLRPYTVMIKRKEDGGGYDVRITVDVEVEIQESKRVMALDINAGHVDFAVAEKRDLRPIAVGRIDCHELLSSRKEKNKIIIYKMVNKIANVAKHYKAEVVTGKLKTQAIKGCRRSNRKIHRMSQFKLRQVLRHKLPLRGIGFNEHSEAHTSKVGTIFSKLMGLDVHKASAYALAVKLVVYQIFTFLCSVPPDEGDGILRRWLSGGSGLTVLIQPHAAGNGALNGLGDDDGPAPEAAPQFMGWGGGVKPFRGAILQVKV